MSPNAQIGFAIGKGERKKRQRTQLWGIQQWRSESVFLLLYFASAE